MRELYVGIHFWMYDIKSGMEKEFKIADENILGFMMIIFLSLNLFYYWDEIKVVDKSFTNIL